MIGLSCGECGDIIMNQFKIGDVKITRIIESEAAWPGTWLMPNATGENVQKDAD